MPKLSKASSASNQLAFMFDAPVERDSEIAVASIAPPTLKPRTKTLVERRMQRLLSAVTNRDELRLTVDEAAEVLSLSVKTLEAWRRLGKGPAFVKLGRSVRYEMRALDQFTRSRTVRNSAEGRLLDAGR